MARSLQEKVDDANRARAGETILAEFKNEAFHCQFCQVYAPHRWEVLYRERGGPAPIYTCMCTNCDLESFWLSLCV